MYSFKVYSILHTMLESLALSKRSLLYFFLVSLIFLSVFYYKSAIAAGSDFPGPHIGYYTRATISNGRMFKSCGYMILSRGDKVSFDIVISRVPWFLNITVHDLLNEKSYSFNQVYYISRVPTPEFIAPQTSLYYYEVVAGHLGNESYDASFTLASSQIIRYDVISRIPFFILVVVALIVIVEFTSKKLRVVNKVIHLFRWEFLSMNTWIFYILTLYTYSLFFVTFPATCSSSCIEPYSAIYGPIMFNYRSSYLIVYTLLAATCVNMIFAYSRETKFERTMDLLPLTRRRKFLIRLLAIFTALYFPLIIGSFMIYVIWIPDLIVKKPVLFLQAYLSTLFHYLIIFFAVITYTLLPAIVFSRISLSLMLSALPPIVLYLYSNVIPKDLYILNLHSLISNAPYWFLLEALPNPHKYIRSLDDLLYILTTKMGPAITFIPGFIIILIISYIIYSRRESP